ncbi:unnamed protein product [Cuscuta epithymum]|uniref:Reverse transcriptase zinc-binding domain-containing protein n=1 Tax=Cuscuta epithymum TaxID=186058 RepID=A0AAV0G5T8_9ASTE|nr:unnamed protein product [Cuscuta epithymum]
MNGGGGKSLWNLAVPPKFKYLAWQMLDGTLPTVDNLRRKGVSIQTGCNLCGASSESVDHALQQCAWVQQVWEQEGIQVELERPVGEWLRGRMDTGSMEERGKFVSLLWSIWKKRNNTIWKGQKDPTTSVVNGSMSMVSGRKDAQQEPARASMRATNEVCKW